MAEIFSPVILVLAFPFSFFLVLAICAIQPMREAGAEPCLSMRMALVLLFEFGAVCGGNVRGDAEGKTAVFFLLVLALCNSEIRRMERLWIFLLLYKNLGKKI